MATPCHVSGAPMRSCGRALLRGLSQGRPVPLRRRLRAAEPGRGRGNVTGLRGTVRKASDLMGEVLIGTASWTDKTLLESGWYPDDVDTPEKRLAYYAEQFRLVEVDATYYSLPSERNSELWAQRTPEGFVFDVKAFSLLT